MSRGEMVRETPWLGTSPIRAMDRSKIGTHTDRYWCLFRAEGPGHPPGKAGTDDGYRDDDRSLAVRATQIMS
jgi:hypothetical protein